MIPRREEGVTHVIEFTFALTLFLLIIQAFSTTMDFRIGVDLDSNDNRIAATRSITLELAGSSGNASGTVNWETLEWGTGSPQLSAGLTVGLLAATGVLSLAKCEALAKFTYNGLRDELGTKEGRSVEVRTLSPDARVSFWGGDVSKSTVSVTEERILLLRTADGDVPAKLRVTLFSGVTPDTTLRLTEVMYQPVAGTEWVEIYNPSDGELSLEGLSLTDDHEEFDKHILGDLTIEGGGFQLLWADSDEEDGDTHLSFRLSKNGESLGLYYADGTLIDGLNYSAQATDYSAARIPDGSNTWVITEDPTPGASNGE